MNAWTVRRPSEGGIGCTGNPSMALASATEYSAHASAGSETALAAEVLSIGVLTTWAPPWAAGDTNCLDRHACSVAVA